MLLHKSSGVLNASLRSQLLLPGSLSGAGLEAIHLLGGSAVTSCLNLAPPQSGVAATQGMIPVGAVSFANATYASLPGAASGIAPSLLSPYFETADMTLCMAVRSSGTFTGSNLLIYANTFANDTGQSGSPAVGTQLKFSPNLTVATSWSASGSTGNQNLPAITAAAAVEGNWHWLTLKVNSTTRQVTVANVTAGLSGSMTASGSNPRNPNGTVPFSFGAQAASGTLQQPCDIAAIVYFTRALAADEDALLYQTFGQLLAGLSSDAIII